MKERALFATKIGVVATTVGSAVGLGNIWRFPYETGTHGGGAFIIIYILCVFAIGIPVMCSEFVMGRSTHRNVRGAFKMLSPKGSWHWMSYLGIVASLMILSFYSVVAGWTLEYLYQSVMGTFESNSAEDFTCQFNEFSMSPWRPVVWTLIFLGLNFIVLRRGVQKGIERLSNILMPLLFIILIIFAVNSLLLPQAQKGLEFLFNPDFSKITPKVVLGAMGQAFFSLSLGLSGLLTYSSYFSNDTPLVRSAVIVAVLDTAVAILAGIIIFPAVFSFGAEPTAGPKLVFEVLPNIFQQMPGAYIWSIMFFVLLFFASITSTISMSEISIAFFMEEGKMSRNKATILNTGIAVIFGVLCALSFGVLSDCKIFGKTLFEFFDYTSSNILLPLGGMAFSIFVGWFMNKKIVNSQLTNNGTITVRIMKVLLFCIRYVAPLAIGLIFLYGLDLIQF
ncbi:MAG: sodium-dependent transporter [Muribaculaceae bacterium]